MLDNVNKPVIAIPIMVIYANMFINVLRQSFEQLEHDSCVFIFLTYLIIDTIYIIYTKYDNSSTRTSKRLGNISNNIL